VRPCERKKMNQPGGSTGLVSSWSEREKNKSEPFFLTYRCYRWVILCLDESVLLMD
jgi:hypothetical protein